MRTWTRSWPGRCRGCARRCCSAPTGPGLPAHSRDTPRMSRSPRFLAPTLESWILWWLRRRGWPGPGTRYCWLRRRSPLTCSATTRPGATRSLRLSAGWRCWPRGAQPPQTPPALAQKRRGERLAGAAIQAADQRRRGAAGRSGADVPRAADTLARAARPAADLVLPRPRLHAAAARARPGHGLVDLDRLPDAEPPADVRDVPEAGSRRRRRPGDHVAYRQGASQVLPRVCLSAHDRRRARPADGAGH